MEMLEERNAGTRNAAFGEMLKILAFREGRGYMSPTPARDPNPFRTRIF